LWLFAGNVGTVEEIVEAPNCGESAFAASVNASDH
jgi:hypothetical protein